ncbi:MAG TPA: hypothetical protein VHT05_05235 [Candidatus Elarobacter sp.]|nr:hypothetical protein [Candidatus Elarobacter sp.]
MRAVTLALMVWRRRSFLGALASVSVAGGAALLGSGCEPAAEDADQPVLHPVPAPKNPDLGAVMERYYQLIEGKHWQFAYAMLAPAYRAHVSEDALAQQYAGFSSADIDVRQQSDRVVIVRLDATERASGKPVAVQETVTLSWNGADWKIAAISRRSVPPAATS